jgi:hypothetical protein
MWRADRLDRAFLSVRFQAILSASVLTRDDKRRITVPSTTE